MAENKQSNFKKVLFFTTLLIIGLLSILTIIGFLNNSINTLFVIGLLIVLVLSGFLLFLILRFFYAIKLINSNAEQLSKGNLNINDILAHKTQGLESLTIAFNDMKRNLLNFIESTKTNVIVLSDAVYNITKSLDMSYKGNEHIAQNMNLVAEKAHEQLNIVNNTLKSIEEVAGRATNITNSLASIEKFVENTVKMTEDGSQNVDKYNEQMEVISTNLSDTAAFIEALNSHLNEIDQVNGLIINITEQLKLLSLNSSVEAARAGEAGKGFVVVAQEMNKLSSATRDSIGQINKLLNNILNSNSKVSESISSCVESFEISKEIFNSVKESFYAINKNTYILSDDMKNVYEESRQINENTKNISDQGEILHEASNEISSITQDVAAVTQESLAENEEINNQALSLQNMLSGIENLLKRYRTAVVPVDQDSPKRLKIAFLSPLDNIFWENVRQGALYAQTELKAKNIDVDYIGFQKMDKTFNDTIMNKINEDYDGIIFPGLITGIDKIIAAANKKNIALMTFNSDFNNKDGRISYFGPDLYTSSMVAAEVMVEALNGEGSIAVVRGSLDIDVYRVRRNAISETLQKKKMKINTDIEVPNDEILIYKMTKEALHKFHNLAGIISMSGGNEGVARAVDEMGLAGKVKIVCFDYDEEVIKRIKKGHIHAAIGQDPFGQGHDPIIHMYNYLVTGERPDSVCPTRSEVIDIRNVTEY